MTAPAPSLSAVVILRIGADHRVSGWAKTPRAARDWALVLSPYQEIPDLAEFEPDAVIPREGGKWDVLHDILTERPELLTLAPRVWLPDDDIEAEAATVARFLAIAAAQDLALAQPALTPDSEFSHYITVRNPLTRLRRTNFVELMAPLLSPQTLVASLPDMKGRPAAKGLDFVWQDHVDRPARRIAIVDAAAMAHRRPIGAHLVGRAMAAGQDVNAERDDWIARRIGRWPRPVALGPGGRPGAFALAVLGLLATPRVWRRRWAVRIAKHLRAQLLSPAFPPRR
ncbi:hypothetical protein [uncultured Albimonas sp.]|uniref:hypothetical protein n=1 Tax=uncultured Albimonas sp. TaxID=1331701 RepID=UPI0030EC21EF|tara:strand:+ start:8747 stop:9598 length:852 start_codon:yes stop_codon:yes gene_type:complete